MKAQVDRYTQWFNGNLPTHTVKETVRALNTPQIYQNDLYTDTGLTNLVGSPTNTVGSYIAGEWWKRNMAIQGHILRNRTTKTAQRGLVIFGASHAAVLDQLFRLAPRYELVPVDSVLK